MKPCRRHPAGAVAQSVEHATPGEEVAGSIPAVAAGSLLFGSVSVQCDRLRQKSWSPHSVSCVGHYVKLSDVSRGTRPRYNLVVDEDVKKPNKQTCFDSAIKSLTFSPHWYWLSIDLKIKRR